MENTKLKDEIIGVINLVREEFGVFRGEFLAFRGEVNGQFDEIDRRFDGIDRRFDGVDIRLDGVDTRLDGIDLDIRALGVGLEELDHKFTLMSEGQDVMREILETRVARIEEVLGMEHRI